MTGLTLRVLPAVLAVLLFSAPAATADVNKIQTMQKEGLGSYLTDTQGMTLYYYTKDTPGKSTCMGECLAKWPAVMTDKVTAMEGLDVDFGSITRDDGVKQATFRGYPLYYYVKDTKAGDVTGQGVGNVWYIVDPTKFPSTK